MKTLLVFLISILFLSAQENWELMNPTPFTPRHHPVTFDLDSYGYVVCGAKEVDFVDYVRDFFRYDHLTDTWEQLEDFPGPERGFSYGDTWNGKAYMGFGRDNAGNVLNDLWEFDPETMLWTELTPCPDDGRLHPAFTIADGVLYVGLGNNRSGNLNDFWAYDIELDSWRRIDSLPGPPRHHPYYFTVNDVAYAGFGHGNNGAIYNDFYMYDVEIEEWVKLENFPGEERVAGTQFDYNGKGYILSGQGVDHENFDYGEFWEYDPGTMEWTELEPHPESGRWAPGNFLIGHKLFFMAGLSNDSLESNMFLYEMPIPASIRELAQVELIYPNPTTDHINIDNATTSEYRILDVFGKEIQSGQMSNKVDVSNLASGQYFIVFDDKYGKFVIEN